MMTSKVFFTLGATLLLSCMALVVIYPPLIPMLQGVGVLSGVLIGLGIIRKWNE